MHDVTDIEQRGVPAGFVASDEFVDAAAVQAKSLGFDAARVFVTHPIQDRTEDEIRWLAEESFDEIAAMIVDRAGEKS